MTSRRLHTAFVQLGIPHSAFRIPHSAFVPRTGLHHAAARSKQTDGWPWIERLGNAECGMRNAECCLQIEATGRCRQDRSLYARAGRSNTTSRRLHAAFVQLGIPHSAFRTPHSAFVPRTDLHHAAARSEQPDGRPWIERLGNAECGVRNAECCLQIEATGRCRQDRAIRARAGCSNTTSRRLHAAFVQLGIPHSAFRIPHSAFVPRTDLHLAASTPGVHGWSAVDRTIRECGMRSAECGMLFADRGDWAMQTGPFTMCAGGMLQHDKQATSHCLCAARYSAFRIPHSALRIRSQNRPPPRGFHARSTRMVGRGSND